MSRATMMALAAGLGAVALAGCAGDSSPPPTWPAPQLRVDGAPAWSHDGTRVAFARHEASTLGPEGIYAMDWPGGTPFLVRSLIVDGLLGLSFSADDETLIVNDAGFMNFYPVGGGFADSWAGSSLPTEPDASHDGTTVAYVKFHATKASIWFFHRAIRVDTVVTAGGSPLVGTHPRFSPGDSLLAYVGDDGLFVWRRATGQRIRLTTGIGPPSSHFAPRWLDSSRILFDQREADGTITSFVLDRSTGGLTPVPGGLGGSEAISGGRDSVLVEGRDFSDPALTKILLFVRGLDSPAATARQVTRFAPPIP